MKKIKKLSKFFACCLLSSTLAAFPVLAAESDGPTPEVNFEYCSIDFLPDKLGSDGSPLRCLINDLFYIEYPGSWFFGTNEVSPIVFFNDSETEKTTNVFQTFQDSSLIGTEDQIDLYIQGGGLTDYLSRVLQISDLTGYQFVTQAKEESILVYSLNKDGETAATVVVWTSFGQLSIRDERPAQSVDYLRDYGRISVIPVWDQEDFSSLEAIQAYVNSGKLNDILMLSTDQLSWTAEPFQTVNHSYLLCEGSCDFLKVSVYIPVVPAGMKKWLVSFDVFQDSGISYNAYNMQKEIINTFKILK